MIIYFGILNFCQYNNTKLILFIKMQQQKEDKFVLMQVALSGNIIISNST